MGYLSLLSATAIPSSQFWSKYFSKLKTVSALQFFLMNIAFGQFIGALVEMIQQQRFELLFIRISELLFILPFAMGGLIAVTILLYILAISFGGKGSFLHTMNANALASTPLIALFIPALQPWSVLYYIFALLVAYPIVHRYPIHKAFVTLAIPTLLLVLVSMLVGLFSKL